MADSNKTQAEIEAEQHRDDEFFGTSWDAQNRRLEAQKSGNKTYGNVAFQQETEEEKRQKKLAEFTNLDLMYRALANLKQQLSEVTAALALAREQEKGLVDNLAQNAAAQVLLNSELTELGMDLANHDALIDIQEESVNEAEKELQIAEQEVKVAQDTLSEQISGENATQQDILAQSETTLVNSNLITIRSQSGEENGLIGSGRAVYADENGDYYVINYYDNGEEGFDPEQGWKEKITNPDEIASIKRQLEEDGKVLANNASNEDLQILQQYEAESRKAEGIYEEADTLAEQYDQKKQTAQDAALTVESEQKKLTAFQEEYDNIEKNIAEKQAELEKLQKDEALNKEELEKVQKEIEQLEEEKGNLENKIENLENDIQELEKKNEQNATADAETDSLDTPAPSPDEQQMLVDRHKNEIAGKIAADHSGSVDEAELEDLAREYGIEPASLDSLKSELNHMQGIAITNSNYTSPEPVPENLTVLPGNRGSFASELDDMRALETEGFQPQGISPGLSTMQAFAEAATGTPSVIGSTPAGPNMDQNFEWDQKPNKGIIPGPSGMGLPS